MFVVAVQYASTAPYSFYCSSRLYDTSACVLLIYHLFTDYNFDRYLVCRTCYLKCVPCLDWTNVLLDPKICRDTNNDKSPEVPPFRPIICRWNCSCCSNCKSCWKISWGMPTIFLYILFQTSLIKIFWLANFYDCRKEIACALLKLYCWSQKRMWWH